MAEKILVASGKGGVGKTSVTVGLCKALHKCGKKVLIIDCDMLRSVDLLTGVTEKLLYDWGDVILGRCEASQAVYTSADVDVMTCPFSYEGIDGEKMKNLVALFDEQYDYIFLDCPPVNLVSDALTISTYTDGVLYIVNPEVVYTSDVEEGIARLKFINAKIYGFVANAIDNHNNKYLGKYKSKYGYSYRRALYTAYEYSEDEKND